jgi:glycosyltransferase involved in cell wall biosynthesis
MKNNGPIVSVHMVTYNHEKYISQSIEGVLSQITDFEFEIVIGEDKSTDGTLLICREYQKKYPKKIRLVERSVNIGSLNNFIDLFNHCNGKYIAICEGDDYWTDPLKLQKQVDILEENFQYAICSTKVFHEKISGAINKDMTIMKNEFTLKDVVFSNLIRTCSVVFRRDSLISNDINLSKYIVDKTLWVSLLLNGRKSYSLDDYCATYRQGIGISSSFNFDKNEIRFNWIILLKYGTISDKLILAKRQIQLLRRYYVKIF